MVMTFARRILLITGVWMLVYAGILYTVPPREFPHEYISVILMACISLWEGRKCLPA